MEQKDLRHFFFGMTIEKLVKDIELYRKISSCPNPIGITVRLFHKPHHRRIQIQSTPI
jgi:hypothetical protein